MLLNTGPQADSPPCEEPGAEHLKRQAPRGNHHHLKAEFKEAGDGRQLCIQGPASPEQQGP